MSDDADRAAPGIEATRDAGVAEIRSKVPQPGERKPRTCECGEVIPAARAAIGYTNCIDCAEARDNRDRMHRKR